MSIFSYGTRNTAELLREREDLQSQERIRKSYQVVPQSFSADGTIEFGSSAVIRHVASDSILCSDISGDGNGGIVYAEIDGERLGPIAKSTFVLVKPDQGARVPEALRRRNYDRNAEKQLKYGEPVQIMCNPSLVLNEKTEMLGAPLYLRCDRATYGEAYSMNLTKNAHDSKTHFVVCPRNLNAITNPYSREMLEVKDKPVRSGDQITLKHGMSNLPLGVESANNNFNPARSGQILSVSCGNPDFRGGASTDKFIWSIELSSNPEASIDSRNLPKRIANPKELMKKIRQIISENGNNHHGIREFSRMFRIMDTSKDGRLEKDEITIGFERYGISLDEEQISLLFEYIDADRNGFVNLDEFLVALRGPLTKRRLKMIFLAYDVLDTDGNGEVTLDEVARLYDTSYHPDVIDGKKTHEQVIQEFMMQWDNGGDARDSSNNNSKKGDGVITKEEFVHYYRDVSASIDDDDYFELMMRNAWHISGGKGWCENTSNIRVLVVHNDNSSEVVELINDFGISRQDMPAIRAKLRKQGVNDIKRVSLAD